MVGLPVYGRTWTLASSLNTGVGAAGVGAGTAGPISQEAGILLNYEVGDCCSVLVACLTSQQRACVSQGRIQLLFVVCLTSQLHACVSQGRIQLFVACLTSQQHACVSRGRI